MDVYSWFQQMERLGQADIPYLSIQGRMLTPRQIIAEINGQNGAEIRQKMGW